MNFLLRTKVLLCMGLTGLFFSSLAIALDSDKNAPIAIDSDNTSIDFRTGKRVLTGNVEVTQGTLNIKADKIVLTYKDNKLDTVTAYGKPVKFKQLPEGKKEMVYGESITLKLEQAKNLITLKKKAKVRQGTNVITGKIIYYNMKTSKMTIKGQSSGKKKTSTAKQPKGSKKVETGPAERSSSGRTRIVIQPGSMK